MFTPSYWTFYSRETDQTVRKHRAGSIAEKKRSGAGEVSGSRAPLVEQADW
ncbi:MAG: hypothetical protein ABIQ64_02565 [Candidatus Saccharimonadales bacterium]